jgi:hypothetical protein
MPIFFNYRIRDALHKYLFKASLSLTFNDLLMKNIYLLTLLLLLKCTTLSAQDSPVKLRILLGTRIVDDKSMYGTGFKKNRKMFPAAAIGLELSHNEYPFSFSIQRDYQAVIYAFNAVDSNRLSLPSFLHRYRRFDHLILYWRVRPKISIGLGHYWDTVENIVHHLAPVSIVSRYRGFEASFIYHVDWLDIELRRQVNYYPLFDILDHSNTSFALLYRLGKRDAGEKESTKPRRVEVSAIVGSRLFIPKGIKTIRGERLDKVAWAPVIGLEFLWPKQHLSFNIDKDFWVGINAGSFTRNLKGFITNTALGFKYHQPVGERRHIRYGLSATWIDDYQIVRDIRETTQKGTKLRYHDFGIGANISYEFLRNWDVEAKHTFTLIEDKSPLTLRRFSVGLVHRFNP